VALARIVYRRTDLVSAGPPTPRIPRSYPDMTTTETFDPRTAKTLAAAIVDRHISDENEEDREFAGLHEKIFAWLGATPDDVAARLTEAGVTGTRPELADNDGAAYGDLVDGKGCALAVFFREICGAAAADLAVDGGLIYWNGSDGVAEYGNESFELPEQLVEFQRKYQDFGYELLYAGDSGVRMVPSTPDAAFAFLRG
jgi:hypothetical protein